MAKKAGFTHDDTNNISVDWYTPPWIFEKLGIQFDLDPCHPENKIPWIPVKKHYCLKDNGLISPWVGNVWLNPPYGKNTSEWLHRMHNHRNGISLVFARTDCAWFHDYVAKADAILFLRGRVKFIDGLNKAGKSGAGCGSMLISWGKSNTDAMKKMDNFGKFIELTNDVSGLDV
jgi:hypothetical protein